MQVSSAVAELLCPGCGWSGEEEDLIEGGEEEVEVQQRGYYSIGQPMKAFVYHRLECPHCKKKLGLVQKLHGMELARITIASESARDVVCSECGWKGKDVELIDVDSELQPEDALFRYVYRDEGLGNRKHLCPSCGNVVERGTIIFGLER